MTAKRIHILGGTGSGKSTVARSLSERLNIPAFGLDDLHWDNSGGYLGIHRDAEDKQRMLSEILQNEAWILEGVYYRWLADAFERADVIVILTTPLWIRQARVFRRFVHGKLGRHNGQEESLRSLWENLRWNQRYDRAYLPATRDFIANLGKRWVDCRTFEDVAGVIDGSRF